MAGSIEERELLTQNRCAEFRRTVRVVYSRASRLGCPGFDCHLLGLDWWRKYIASRKNIAWFENQPLPDGLHAAVIKWERGDEDSRRSLFAILTQKIDDQVTLQFSVAHEMGHILLHGKLMERGMVIPRVAASPHMDTNDRRRVLEMEANVYALLSLIPTLVIWKLEEFASPTTSNLQQVIAYLYDYKGAMDRTLIEERLLIHRALELEIPGFRHTADPVDRIAFKNDFARFIGKRRSWTFDGVHSMSVSRTTSQPTYSTLPTAALVAIRSALPSNNRMNEV